MKSALRVLKALLVGGLPFMVPLILSCRRPEPQAAVPVPTPAPTAAATPAATAPSSPDPQALVGRWARSDASYVLAITKVGPDGLLEVTYANPQPIHVSRAEWKIHDGRLMMAVELTDQNYPGNYYTLAYDPGSDSLSGVYNHLGLKQSFDVAFSRIRP